MDKLLNKTINSMKDGSFVFKVTTIAKDKTKLYRIRNNNVRMLQEQCETFRFSITAVRIHYSLNLQMSIPRIDGIKYVI